MCSKEQLVAYLYDDVTPAERVAVEAHAAWCAPCREEIALLRQTRQHLTEWAPPEPQFDLRVTRRAEPAEPRHVRRVPAWAMAAAASLLLLAGAAAVANLEVRVGPDGFVVRTGWGETGTPPAPEAVTSPGEESRAADQGLAGELRALAARLGELEAAQAAQVAVAQSGPVGSRDEEVAAVRSAEARLRRLIAESERRQRTDMALQLAAVWKDFNAARTSDFVRVQESLERVQGQTNLQLRQQRDSLQSLYRISLQK